MTQGPQTQTESIPIVKPNQLPQRRELSAKGLKAKRMIKRYAAMASGAALVPGPLASQVAIAALLGTLLKDLCRLYGVSFSDHQVKIIVAAVLGGAHTGWLSHFVLRYVNSYASALIPVGALLVRPAVSALIVLYIGKLFLGHLESGSWTRVKEQGLSQFRHAI